MITVVVAILIAPCDSGAVTDRAKRVTEVHACADTVKVERRELADPVERMEYQKNFFRLRKVTIGGKHYIVLR